MDSLNELLSALQIKATVFHNGQYCGLWAIDTSGSGFMNFHVVSRGKCCIEVDGNIFELDAGDAVFMPTDIGHRISRDRQNAAVKNQAVSISMMDSLDEESTGLVCGHFIHNHPVFSLLIKELPNVLIIKNDRESATAKILQMILDESATSTGDNHFLINRLSDCLFYLLIRDNLDVRSGVLAATLHPKLTQVISLIHTDTKNRISVDALAERAAMSRSAFLLLFKEIVGISPVSYATQWKMTKAYRWLADDNISTYEAAIRCGYESEASFAKAFKKINGIGPGAVRKQHG